MSTHNPFEAFDDTWAKTPEAPAGGGGTRVPKAVYKFVLASVNLGKDGEDKIVDREVIDNRAKQGSLGLKVFAEIVEPENVPDPRTQELVRTRGKIIDYVFWVTEKNMPFIKRNIHTITGSELDKARDLLTIPLAGCTFEAGVDDEEYNGRINSRIQWFNPWKPGGTPQGAPAAPTAPPVQAGTPGAAAPPVTTGTSTTAPAPAGAAGKKKPRF